MTITTYDVGAAGRTYTTVQLAWAAIPSTIATGDTHIITLKAGLYTDGLDCSSSKTINGTGQVIIKPEAGAAWYEAATPTAGYDNTKGVAIEAAPFTKAIFNLQDKVSVEGIQFKGGHSNSQDYGCINFISSAQNSHIAFCVFAADNTHQMWLDFRYVGLGISIYNNLFVTTNTANVVPFNIEDSAYAPKLIGNTMVAVNGSTGNWNTGTYSALLQVIDNAIFGFAGTNTARIDTGNSGHNFTDQATFPGSANVTSLSAAAQFTSLTGTINLRPEAGNSLVAGITHALLTLDAMGNTRAATPTGGGIEYVVVVTSVGGNATEADDTASGGATPGLPTTVGGNATEADDTAAGGALVGNVTVGGNAQEGDDTASGGAAPYVGTLTIPALKNWGNASLLTSELINNVIVTCISPPAHITMLANQTTDATTADLVLQSTAYLQGVSYLVTGFNTDGSKRFSRIVTAT
jgi:hypothetical protein